MKVTIQTVKTNWKLFTLENTNGMKISLLDFGGTLTEIQVPDRHGKLENVVLGYKNYDDYENKGNYFGSIVGRVAGRIQNASFTIDGKLYTLEKNKGNHHIHGGTEGFHQIVWEATTFKTEDSASVKLTHTSPDGDAGYPGTVTVAITYTLTENNRLILDYSAVSDKPTALALTNHTYFNLTGNLTDTIHNHHITMNADELIELDSELIPTGKKLDVTATPFDFRKGRYLSEGITSSSAQNLVASHGYDHYFIFNEANKGIIDVYDEISGRKMSVQTTQPGTVMYTSNTLKEGLELSGGKSKPYLGVCFETQAPPASLHHKGFPSVILEAQEAYEKQTIFAFSCVE